VARTGQFPGARCPQAVRSSGSRELGIRECVLRAELPGYDSTTLDLSDRSSIQRAASAQLVLTPKQPGQDVGIDPSTAIPGSVRKTWTLAENAMSAETGRKLASTARGDPARA